MTVENSKIATSRPLRVLLITPDFPPEWGGIQRLLYRITDAMDRVELCVVTMGSTGAREFDSGFDGRVVRVPTVSRTPIVRNIVFNGLAGLVRIPVRPDVILNGHVVSAPVATWLGRRFSAPIVLYTYGKEVKGRPGVSRWAMQRSDAAIAVSRYTRAQLLEVAAGDGPEVKVINPGVEVPPDLLGVRAQTPTVLTIARIRDAYKGHDVILEAWPRVLDAVPDAQWVIIGDGRHRRALEARSRELGISESIKFLGAVSDDEKHTWLAQSHVFAMPARYPPGEIAGEGFPVVYLEAAAWGLPAVAGKVGGPAEAVVDGVTGLLVDPTSSAEVGAALTRLLSDVDAAAAMGQAARERAQSRFTWSLVAAELRELLATVASRRTQ